MEVLNEGYLSRCIKRLKGWNAPLSGWECLHMYDVEGDDNDLECINLFTCELCNCSQVRYVHVMHHSEYFEEISVGCICAGIMEGDIFTAKERERQMKNRAKRKENYLKRGWHWSANGNMTIRYKNHQLTIIPSRYDNGGYGVVIDGKSVWCYKGKQITNTLSATLAAFDLIDPPIGGRPI